MNKDRRDRLTEIISIIQEQMAELESIKEEEDEAFNNLPEGIQCSEKGEAMEENVTEMDDIYSDLESTIDRLQELIDK